MDDVKNEMIETALEKYNLADKQAAYLKAELEDMKVNQEDSIIIRNSGQFNYKMEIVKQAIIVEGERHICYL